MLNHARTLRYLFPDWQSSDGDYGTDGDGEWRIRTWNRVEPQPTEADLDAAKPAADVAWGKVDLTLYAEEAALRHGATLIDPNSATNEPVADASANLDTIRQQQGRARVKMQRGKRNGSGGGVNEPGSQARNNTAQQREEDLAEELVNVSIEIESGLITTTASATARISAVNLIY